MHRYIFKRILMLIPVLIAVSFVVYFLMDLAPGDIISTFDTKDMTIEEVEELRDSLGLNDPFIVRYGRYLMGMLRGDLGDSFSYHRPVLEVFMERFPATIYLALTGTLVAVLIAVPLGIIAATHHRSWIDGGSMVAALLGLSMPNFWVGLLLIILFALNLGWLPSNGNDHWYSVILPAITVGTGCAGTMCRMTRSSMLDVLRQDYLRTARAKGVSEKQVVRKHALRNALIPILTVFGSVLGNALGGSVLTETVFAWPGVGRLLVKAINDRDMAMATGCIILFTLILTVTLLFVDIAYAFVDPRVKARYSK